MLLIVMIVLYLLMFLFRCICISIRRCLTLVISDSVMLPVVALQRLRCLISRRRLWGGVA